MEETPNKEGLIDQLKNLIRDAVEYLNSLLTLQQARFTSFALSGVLFILQIMFACVLGLAAFILFNIALGMGLNKLLGNSLYAVGILGGVYILLAILLFFQSAPLAQKPQVMIFHRFRISELEQDAIQKRETFEKSKAHLMEKLHPMTLLKENKKAVVGTLLSMVALGKVFGKLNRKFGPMLKGNMVFSVLKAAWFWRLLDLSFNIYKLTGPKNSRSK